MTLRLGLLSTANINRAVLGGAARSDDVEVCAVASRDGERARAYAAEHGLATAHGSYEALLEDPDVDAIYNPLPNSLHVPWSERALAAGKHVLCEKPLTWHRAEAERAFDAAEAAGRVLAEAFMWRHMPQTAKLQELLAAGTVGEVRIVRAMFSFQLMRDVDVRLEPELDGGSLMDVGAYCVSGMRLVAGTPTRVTAQQVLAPGGVDMRFVGTLAFAGGALGTFDSGFDLGGRRERLEIFGPEGTLVLHDPWKGRAPGIELWRGEALERIEVEAADPYACELADFAAAARGDRPHPFGREDAVEQARTLEALREAATTGAAVDV